MKKILSAVALATFALAASATEVFVGYDYNHFNGSPRGTNHADVVRAGVAQQTRFGKFDASLQALRTHTAGFANDRANGYELGYSVPLKVGQLDVTPRIAFGSMANINPAGTGFDLHARYYRPSVEVSLPITPNVKGFASFSHLNGINAESVAASNRVQVGADFSLNKTFVIRAAYSYANTAEFNKFATGPQSGVSLRGTYSF